MSLIAVSILLSLTFKEALAVTQDALKQAQGTQTLHTIDTTQANKNATQLEETAAERRTEAKKAREDANKEDGKEKAVKEHTAEQAEKIADQAENDAIAARDIANLRNTNSKNIQNAVNQMQQAAEKSGTVKSNGSQDFSELASKGVKEYQLGSNNGTNPRYLDQTAKDAQFKINSDGSSSVRINGQDYAYTSQTVKNAAGQVQYTYKGANGTVTFTKTHNSVTSSISPSTPSTTSSSSGSSSGSGFESNSYKKTSYLGSQIINLDDYFLEGK